MINYDSILSAFDGKPTLLQWLKMVKKALDESILKNVNITQNGEKVVFSFNFEDGTSISTPEVTLPKGDTGATGPKGNDGVSITGIDTVGNEVVGDETLTTLRANYSDQTSSEFIVKAKNGKDVTAGGKLYLHSVRIQDSGSLFIYFNAYSSKKNLTLEDALSQIPFNAQIPVVLFDNNRRGVISALKEENNKITLYGVVYNSSESKVEFYSTYFIASKIKDILLGENL